MVSAFEILFEFIFYQTAPKLWYLPFFTLKISIKCIWIWVDNCILKVIGKNGYSITFRYFAVQYYFINSLLKIFSEALKLKIFYSILFLISTNLSSMWNLTPYFLMSNEECGFLPYISFNQVWSTHDYSIVIPSWILPR